MDDRGADVNCVLAGDVMVAVPVEPLEKDTPVVTLSYTLGAGTGRISAFAVDVDLPAGKTCVNSQSGICVPHECVVAHNRIAIRVELDAPGTGNVDDVVFDDDAVGPIS